MESGRRHKNRPKLLAALELCRKQRATLVIAKLDRLARNVHFISGLLESGVEFVCCDNPQANKPMLQMIAVFAEWERELISQRTREAMQRAKAHLEQHGQRTSVRGRVYTKLGNPRLEEAREIALDRGRLLRPSVAVLEMMAALRRQPMSLRGIAAKLNAENVRTPRGYCWYASSVGIALSRHDEITKERNGGNTMGRKNEIAPSSNSPLPELFSAAIPSNSGSSAGREPEFERGDMTNSDEPQRMLNIFTSVGARSFFLTKLDLLQQKIWAKSYTALELQQKLPDIVRIAAVKKPFKVSDTESILAGENVIIRPSGSVTFVQLDDLKAEQLERVRPVSFITIATSPGNYQAWIAVSGVSDDKEIQKDVIRRVRKAVGDADKSASGATRLAGTFNYKAKYAPNYPVVSIQDAAPGRVTTEDQLSKMGLLAAAEPIKAQSTFEPRKHADRAWPDYEICLRRAPKKKDGTPDRSKADFSWALIACTGGHGIEETISRLREISKRAEERKRSDPGYVRVTVENAAAAVARNFSKSRSRA